MNDPETGPRTSPDASFRLGVRLFLSSISVLLGASLVAYAVIRLRGGTGPSEGHANPPGLWLATAAMVLVSVTVERAYRAIRRDDRKALQTGLLVSAALLVAFLVAQTANGISLLGAVGERRKQDLFAFTFFMLTGLHALHILGGMIPLGIAARRSFGGAYDREHHEGIWAVRSYLHLLLLAWLAIFALLST